MYPTVSYSIPEALFVLSVCLPPKAPYNHILISHKVFFTMIFREQPVKASFAVPNTAAPFGLQHKKKEREKKKN
jgi:hypothetical protein